MSDDNVNLSELKLMLENHFVRTDKQLYEMQKDNAEFRTQMTKDFADFKEAMLKEFSDFKEDMRVELQGIRSEIVEVSSEVRVQAARIDSLVHWNYWIIAVLAVILVMPSLMEGVKEIIRGITKGISSLMKKKDSR